MTELRKVLKGGRITLGVQEMKALAVKDGDWIICRVREGYLQILPATITPRTQK